jgi:ABC-2 type transport system permease protein
MRLYWEVARRGYRRYAAYRSATLAGAFTNSIFGLLRAYVLLAVFAHRSLVGSLTATDTVTFSLVAQSMAMVLSVFTMSTEMPLRIRTGDIVGDLYRPVDFQRYWLAQDFGRAAYQAVWRSLPPFLAGALVFHVQLPHHPVTWLWFAISVLLALLVSFAIRFLIGLSAFWLLDDRGLNQLVIVAQSFLSGFIVPIQFFPHWLEALSRALPFAAIVQIPIEIFLEKPSGGGLIGGLALQALWAGVLLVAGHLVLAVATRRVVVQGG